jgi:plastocyanin
MNRAGFKWAAIAAGAVIGFWPTAQAQAVVPAAHVKIVASGGSCTSLFCFQPSSLSVAHGTKVVWKNTTTAPHTVSRCTVAACGVSGGTGTDTGLGSPTITPGNRYKFTFNGTGTYVYYCQIHGFAVMHGTITVS